MSFEVLKNILKNNAKYAEEDRLEQENPESECPFDAWTLNENSEGGKMCPFCGRKW